MSFRQYWLPILLLLLAMLPSRVWADNCGTLDDCYGAIVAAAIVVAAVATVIILLAVFFPEALGIAAHILIEQIAEEVFHIPQHAEDPPGEGWEWRGPEDNGSWYNPETKELRGNY